MTSKRVYLDVALSDKCGTFYRKTTHMYPEPCFATLRSPHTNLIDKCKNVMFCIYFYFDFSCFWGEE